MTFSQRLSLRAYPIQSVTLPQDLGMNDVSPSGRVNEAWPIGGQDVKTDVGRPVLQVRQPVGRRTHDLYDNKSFKYGQRALRHTMPSKSSGKDWASFSLPKSIEQMYARHTIGTYPCLPPIHDIVSIMTFTRFYRQTCLSSTPYNTIC